MKVNKVDSFFLLFGGLWVVLAIPFGLAGYFMLQNEKLYETSGLKTIGVLDSKFVSESRDSKNKVSKSYKVRYHFTNNEGLKVEGEDSVGEELWNGLKESGSINLEFIPGRSGEKNRALGSSSGGNIAGYAFIGIACFMELLGLAFLIPYFKNRAKHKRLHRDGTLIEGEVIGVGPGNITLNKIRQWQIRYSYKDMQGKTHNGESQHMPPHQAEPWNKGDKCKIKFDKSKPSVSIFIGK